MTDEQAGMFWMTAKCSGECWECFIPIDSGERIVWDTEARHAYCANCGDDIAGYSDPNGLPL